jgi:hypothetical protein
MQKQVIGIFLLITLCSILFVHFVSAQNAFTDSINNFFSNAYQSWQAGTTGGFVDATTIKVYIFIIISLLTFSILDTVGIVKNNRAALLVISVVVGILSTYYMSTVEIQSISSIYTSFGGALVTLLPFLILGSFTIRAVMDGNVQLMVMQHIAWGLFTAFLLYSLISGQMSSNIIMIVTVMLSIALTFGNSFFLNWFGKSVLKAKAVAAAQTMTDIESGIKLFRRAGEEVEGKGRRSF